jgi:hypothetical protein
MAMLSAVAAGPLEQRPALEGGCFGEVNHGPLTNCSMMPANPDRTIGHGGQPSFGGGLLP